MGEIRGVQRKSERLTTPQYMTKEVVRRFGLEHSSSSGKRFSADVEREADPGDLGNMDQFNLILVDDVWMTQETSAQSAWGKAVLGRKEDGSFQKEATFCGDGKPCIS